MKSLFKTWLNNVGDDAMIAAMGVACIAFDTWDLAASLLRKRRGSPLPPDPPRKTIQFYTKDDSI